MKEYRSPEVIEHHKITFGTDSMSGTSGTNPGGPAGSPGSGDGDDPSKGGDH